MPSVAAGFFRSVVIWRGAQYPAISDPFATERKRLFDHLAKAVGEGPTLKAMRRIPRENFVPPSSRNKAYLNIALPIGKGQTISQPQMVALAADALELRGDEYVLEVGAGSGYQAAVIAELAPFGSVLAVERIPELLARARRNLAACGIANVSVQPAGPTLGAPAQARFDAILVSAGAPRVPEALLAQLKPAGRLVAPVGSFEHQTLTRVRAGPGGWVSEELGYCSYVPLLGEGAWQTR